MKKILALGLFIATSCWSSSVSGTKIVKLTTLANYHGKNWIQVRFTPGTPISAPQSCTVAPDQGNLSNAFYLLNMTDQGEMGKAMLSILLTALSTGASVDLAGTGTCTPGNEESLAGVSIAP